MRSSTPANCFILFGLLVVCLHGSAATRGDVIVSSIVTGNSNSNDPSSLSLGFFTPSQTVLGAGGGTSIFDYQITAIQSGAPQTSVVATYSSRSTVTSVSTNRRLGTVVITGGGVGTYNLPGRENEVFVNHNSFAVEVNQQAVPASGFAPETALFAFEENGLYFNFTVSNPDQTAAFNPSVGDLIQATTINLDSISDTPDSNYQLVSVPEPGAFVLVASAFCIAVRMRRKAPAIDFAS